MPDTPYSIVTISVLCLLFYGISVVLVRFIIISGEWQRKFWNILLLPAILVAGGIGLLLAITVNFKINLPVTDKLLVWHVDFGVALVLIASFHFLHHLRYYRNFFMKSIGDQKALEKYTFNQPGIRSGNKLDFNLKRLPFSLGFTAMAAQLILIREFLAVFNGNELTIGTVLANWMLLTGAGAFMNRKNTSHASLKGIMTGLFILALIPVITLFMLYWLRNIVLPVGSQPGIIQIITGTAVLLSPFCLLSGWLFSAVSLYLSNALKENAVSLTYSWETLGSLAAGILCSMILIFLFEPFQSMAIVLIVNSIILFFISRNEIFSVRKKLQLYLAVAVFIGIATLIANLDRSAIQFLYPEEKILSFKDTPYGKIVVTDKAGQLNFYDNNTPLFTTNNIVTNEETVHYALLQRKISGNVLLVGGGMSGVAEECLKYPLQRLDCVELNPGIIRLGKRFNLFPSDTRIKVYQGDARMMINKAHLEKTKLLSEDPLSKTELDSLCYEAIILNIPEPATLQINRLYTYEFFRICKNLLDEQGIVALSLASTADYVGDDALKIQSTMYQTLKAVFNNALVIPGEKNYFVASDGPITTAVVKQGSEQKIENEYVNEFYLDDVSLQERSASILKRISVSAPINFDFEPVGCYRQLHYWLSYQGNLSFHGILIALTLLLIIAGIRSSGFTVALFSAGFGSFSLEIILILTYQIIYGYVYLAIGIFITLFMAGLALGVLIAKLYPAISTFKSLIILQLLSGCIILFSLVFINIVDSLTMHAVFIHILSGILIILMALITGSQFHLVTALKAGSIQQVAASSYSADLIGSAAGALLVNTWLVPFYGIPTSLIVVAAVIAVSVLLMLVKKHT